MIQLLLAVIYMAFISLGLGCAPIYPSIIHSTSAHFGAELLPLYLIALLAVIALMFESLERKTAHR